MAEQTLDAKNAEKLAKELEKSKDLEKELVTFAKSFTQQTQKAAKEQGTLGERLKQSAGFMAGLVGADKLKDWQGMVTKMVETNSELHRSIINSGKGAESLNTYKNTAKQLSVELGATHEAANSVVKTLTEKQFLGTSDQISKAAKSTYALARAFGISEKTVAENTVELQKWGQVSADTTTAMYADILKVAQANGLTSEGVQDVMKSTTKWSGILKAFGKTPEDVKKYNMSLAKTVSALEKVGVSAKITTGLLEELSDPERIEDNIPKYAALGISITDAITGNIDADKMGEGLKTFGEKLKQMGPIAGAQYAKSMGVSYKDAIKAASADMAEASQVEMTPEEKAYDQLTKMTEKTKDITEQFKDIVNKVGGMMRSLGPMLLTIAGTFLPLIMAKFKKRFSKDAGDALQDGMKEGADKGVSEAKKKFEDLAQSFKDEELDLEKMRKDALQELANEKKKLLSLAKGDLNAQQAFEAEKKANADRIKTLKEEWITKEKEKQEVEEKLTEAKRKFEETNSKGWKTKYAKNIEEYKKRLENIRKEKENIILRRDEAAKENKNIRNQEQTVKKLKELKKGGIFADDVAWADIQLKNFKLGLEDLGASVAQKAAGIAAKCAAAISDKFSKSDKPKKEKPKKEHPKLDAIKGFGSWLIHGVAKGGALAGKAIGGAYNKFKKLKLKLDESKLGKVVKALGKVGKTMGVIGIVGAIIGKVLSKLKEPLELILDNLIKELQPVFEALMPIIMLLGDLLGALVKLLMPPILKILSFLLKAIGMLAGVLNKKVGKAITDSADKMSAAADKIKNSEMNLNKSVEENTDAVKGKEKITVSGGKVSVSKGNYEDSEKSSEQSSQSSSQVASTQASNNQVVNSINTTNKTNEEIANYLKTLNEKFDVLIVKVKEKEREKEEDKELKASIQAGFTDAIKNNVVTVRTELNGSIMDAVKNVFSASRQRT